MQKRRFLTGLAMALLATQACGSDDGKKSRRSGDAGMAGEGGGAGEPSAGGSAAGEQSAGGSSAGEADAGKGGEPGGAGGQPVAGMAGESGAGGEPSAPVTELLFSVKPGAIGLPTSAVDEAENPQNAIYTSRTGSQELVDGTNTVKVTGAELGLNPMDQIAAFALPQATPEHPLYLFSLADGSEGATPTRVYRDAKTDGDEQSNLYYSDGIASYRYLGEGGDEYGYNGLLATQTSLGLSRGGEGPPDDLTGLMAHDANQPMTEIYFTVAGGALGAEGSVLASVPESERPCTVFKSALDGAQSVAFSCTELGLVAGDSIDALAMLQDAGDLNVVFSVSNSSIGALTTAVNSLVDSSSLGSTVYVSTGDGSNAIFLKASSLGLDSVIYDELDGFTIIDAPQPSVERAAGCSLTPDPYGISPGGELQFIDVTTHVGSNVMLVFGSTTGFTPRVLAYDVETCAELGRQDLGGSFHIDAGLVARPLAGWSAAKPLEKLEYLRITNPVGGTTKVLRRFDATGAAVGDVPISTIDRSSGIYGLVFDPVHARFFALTGPYWNPVVDVFSLPAVDASDIQSEVIYATLPCATGGSITGVDASGNFYLAQQQSDGTTYRVCGYTPTGELLPAPYFWKAQTSADRGFIIPGESYYLFDRNETATIERGTFVAP